MKKLLVLTFLSASLMAPLRAEMPKNDSPHQDMNRRLEKMKSELNLTPEQSPKVEAAIKEEKAARQALMEEMRTKHMDLQKNFEAKLSGILTPEQMEKFKAMRSDMKDEMKERRKERREHNHGMSDDKK